MNEATIIAKLQHYKGCAELDTCIDTKLLNAAIELLEKSYAESSDLFYKLTGVMHFVDKWLDGKELEQDEVNRAATMRDKTLRLVEGLEREVNAAVEDLKNCMHFSNPKNNNVCNFCKRIWQNILRNAKVGANRTSALLSGEAYKPEAKTMYKNPIPCLPEDAKYKKFVIKFGYDEALTVEQAAKEFFAFLEDKGELPKEFIAPNGEQEIEYQK